MKKKDNKLYEFDEDSRDREIHYLVVTALLADITAALMLAASVGILVFTMFFSKDVKPEVAEPVEQKAIVESVQTSEPIEPIPEPEPEPESVVELPATKDEIELLALIAVAEAEGESEEGKRLVIDTVLNRVDSPRWPDTIHEVIHQSGQFAPMSNGRAERCKDKVTDEVRQLVVEELISRTNSEVVYFTAGGYGRYGTPAFRLGNHYFCNL